HQHFMLIDVFTVADNVMLGDERVRRLWLDKPWRAAVSQLARLAGKVHSRRYGAVVGALERADGWTPRIPTAWLDRYKARSDVKRISEDYGLHVDPDMMVEDIPVGVQQRVEIIKALRRDADLLILDEPTAVLTPGETQELLDVMRSLRDAGKSI